MGRCREAWAGPCVQRRAARARGIIEKGIMAKFDGGENTWLAVVREWSFHWTLKEALRAAYANDMAKPKPGWLYLCWDFQEP